VDTDKEFIQIKNISSTTIDLQGWKLSDLSDRFILSEKIDPGATMFWKREITGIALNNGVKEEVKLYNSNGILVDKIGYDKAEEGEIYQLNGEEWEWIKISDFVAKNSENLVILAISTSSEDSSASSSVAKKTTTKTSTTTSTIKKTASTAKTTKATSIIYLAMDLSQAREAEKDDGVRVRGKVSVLPGIFGVQYFYITDKNFGIQVYMYKKDFPKLSVGDNIEVFGIISEASGIKRIKLADKNSIDILATNQKINPIVINLSDIDEKMAGGLVKIKGTVTEIKSTFMYVDDGSDEIAVYFKNGANIDKKKIKEGEDVEVIGILEMKSAGWQIWPRSQSDIEILGQLADYLVKKEEQISATTQDKEKDVAEKYLTATAGGITTLLLGFLVRARGFFVRDTFKKVATIAVGFIKKNKV
jgi:RecJ-like exonuclease